MHLTAVPPCVLRQAQDEMSSSWRKEIFLILSASGAVEGRTTDCPVGSLSTPPLLRALYWSSRDRLQGDPARGDQSRRLPQGARAAHHRRRGDRQALGAR